MYAQMTRNVGESEVFRTNQLNRWPLVKGVMFLANESGVLDSFMTHIMHVLGPEVNSQQDDLSKEHVDRIRFLCK